MSPDYLARLGSALVAYDVSPYVVTAIKLLVFTGARLSEVLGLKWEWIDFERTEARLPDSKTGARLLHLPPPALATLAETPQVEGNPFVIVGGNSGARLINLQKPWRAFESRPGSRTCVFTIFATSSPPSHHKAGWDFRSSERFWGIPRQRQPRVTRTLHPIP